MTFISQLKWNVFITIVAVSSCEFIQSFNHSAASDG